MLDNQIPYKIVSERLLVRCYGSANAVPLYEAVNSSEQHLLPYMRWTVEPSFPLQHHIDYIRATRGRFDRDEDYTKGIFLRENGQYIGGGLYQK